MGNDPSNYQSRRSPEQWRQLIEQQRAGTQTAQARGIAYSTFLYHKRKLSEPLVDCGVTGHSRPLTLCGPVG